ncbi:flavin reductase family protein [Prosthecobacter sp.]|uniref:flavin reductase family protein n=1 Tax=Prosthecobacter sp. TaxID=1965333 RepID=UPI002ABC9162|nr:flavin reductase family protein [Prosthecobacter sp.]MDZ4402337.1 flavin reductase family protein [Prosthecobacter sp.]
MKGLTQKQVLPLAQVYGVLEPGPVVLVTTARAGRANIMTLTWHTMMEFEPPLVGCVISAQNDSFDLLRETGECVLNVPTVELIEQVVGCGNTTGRKVNKFRRFGLTPMPASKVQAPLIAECYANLECRVVERRLVTKYNFFVLEVVQAWIDPRQKRPKTLHHQGEGIFQVTGRRLKRPSPKTSLLAE